MKQQACKRCHGTGQLDEIGYMGECPECDGAGHEPTLSDEQLKRAIEQAPQPADPRYTWEYRIEEASEGYYIAWYPAYFGEDFIRALARMDDLLSELIAQRKENAQLRAELAGARAWSAAWKWAAKHKRTLLSNAYLFAQMCYKPFGMMYQDWRKK